MSSSHKLCMNCQFHKRLPMGSTGQLAMVDVCLNPDFGHPVDGSPIPCVAVRQDRDMCGYKAIGFLKKGPDNAPENPKILHGV